MQKYEYRQLLIYTNRENEYVINYLGKELPYWKYIEAVLTHYGDNGYELCCTENLIGSTIARSFIPWKSGDDVGLTSTEAIIYVFKREATEESWKETEKTFRAELTYLRGLDATALESDRETEEALLDIEEIKKSYMASGYSIVFNHKDRVVFQKGAEEVRFDLDLLGVWIKRTTA